MKKEVLVEIEIDNDNMDNCNVHDIYHCKFLRLVSHGMTSLMTCDAYEIDLVTSIHSTKRCKQCLDNEVMVGDK